MKWIGSHYNEGERVAREIISNILYIINLVVSVVKMIESKNHWGGDPLGVFMNYDLDYYLDYID